MNKLMQKSFLKIVLMLTVAFFYAHAIAAEIGNSIPACMVSPLEEVKPESIQKNKGQVVYVDFWASWCVPCAHSFPFLNELHREFKDKGLQIVGINMDENVDDAKAFLAKTPAQFNIVADTNAQCAKDFDVKAMPSSYLIDRKGIVHHVHQGFRSEDIKELRALVEHLLAAK
jgi:thiol-disulfide isomerase/thioredoxin